jgi:hypothetical protein
MALSAGFIFGFSAFSILWILLKFASMDLVIGKASAFQTLSSSRSYRDVYAVSFACVFFIIFGNLDSSQETSILAVFSGFWCLLKSFSLSEAIDLVKVIWTRAVGWTKPFKFLLVSDTIYPCTEIYCV